MKAVKIEGLAAEKAPLLPLPCGREAEVSHLRVCFDSARGKRPLT